MRRMITSVFFVTFLLSRTISPFFECPFAVNCWRKLHFFLRKQETSYWETNLDIHRRLLRARSTFQCPFFMDIFILAAWEIWKIRNVVIFDAAQASIHLWTVKFKETVLLQVIRFIEELRDSILVWLNSV